MTDENDKPEKVDKRKGMPHLWKPGQSGNPGGRKQGIEKRIRDTMEPDLIAMTQIMIDMVMGRPIPQTMRDGSVVEINVKPRDRQEAYKVLMDRAYGKAKQTIDMTTSIDQGGLSSLDVESLELGALANLRDTIQSQLDPRKRVLDVTKIQGQVPARLKPAAQSAPTIDESIVPAEPVDVNVEPVASAEPAAPLPEPANRIRHVFQGSANVLHATLDLETKDVDVVFANGTRYRFGNFSEELLGEWKLAVSAGKWFNDRLKSKPREHPVRKIR